jgi:hypothetical protein
MAEIAITDSAVLKNGSNNISNSVLQLYENDYTFENVIYTLVFMAASVWIYGSNIALVAELLQVSNKIIRLTISSLDLIISTSSAILFPVVVWRGYDTPELLSRICSVAGMGAHFSNMIICSILATERYVYMAHPMKYITFVTPRRTCAFIACTVVLSYVYVIISELLFERKLYLSRLHTKIPEENGGRVLSIFNLVIFILPSFLTTCFCVCKLKMLQFHLRNNTTNKVHPKEVHVALSRNGFSRHLKMIILISGSLWFCYIPAHGVYSLNVIESNHNWEFRLSRICFVILTFASQSINTASQFYIEPNLRAGLKKLLGFEADFSWQKQVKISVLKCNSDL